MGTRFISLGGCLLVVGMACLTQGADTADEDLAALEERAMTEAVRRVAPAIVRIETFGGQERVGRMLVGQGPTTGLIVSADGYIVSSSFNFIQRPASILVTLHDGQRAPAEIVARDHSCMLVLLKIEPAEALQPPPAVAREAMQVGQWAVAVGRTYELDHPNMSVGILSALGRIWSKAIQTDAKISPSNYGGPLVDIAGNVLGVLVPLSPDSQNEVAGVQWYDSGIGFAIPLTDIYDRLDRLKQGDLYPGVMGITLEGSDIYASRAVIAASQAKSPAYEAGLRAGDVIVEIEGTPIERQAQLKHALGPRYAGDKVRLVIQREEDRVDAVVELTDRLVPYEHPFLGVLPVRDGPDRGVRVRFVYPESGAEAAGLIPKDHILALNEQPVVNAQSLREALANMEIDDEIRIDVERAGERLTLTANLARLPDGVPPELSEVTRPPAGADDPQVELGEIDIKIPEEPNDGFAYVPEDYQRDVSYGLMVYLTSAAARNREQLIDQWRTHCQQHRFILLAPQPEQEGRWSPTEISFLRKSIEDLSTRYTIDPTRVVVGGHQAGGTLAYMAAFRHRDLIRGLVAVDAVLPFRFRPAPNDPIQRLAIYSAHASQSRLSDRIEAGAKLLQSMKYPVTVVSLGEEPRELNDQELSELGRWIDSLDRI